MTGLLHLLRKTSLSPSLCQQVGKVRGTKAWQDGCVLKFSIEMV
jgi:hypothetical protein